MLKIDVLGYKKFCLYLSVELEIGFCIIKINYLEMSFFYNYVEFGCIGQEKNKFKFVQCFDRLFRSFSGYKLIYF